MEREGIDKEGAPSVLLRLALYQGMLLRERAEAMVALGQTT